MRTFSAFGLLLTNEKIAFGHESPEALTVNPPVHPAEILSVLDTS
jgi:hypothetical protein